MYKEGDKVIAPNGQIGIVVSYQEGEGIFAPGHFVKFDDVPMSLFMRDGTLKLLQEFDTKELDSGQLTFNL